MSPMKTEPLYTHEFARDLNAGGSANFLVAENEIYDCGTGGYTAGQGTGFQYMVSPWLYYEAMHIKFVNNIVRNTQGAAVGVCNIMPAAVCFVFGRWRMVALVALWSCGSFDQNVPVPVLLRVTRKQLNGAAGVNGGYNIVMAFNTFYNVGSRSHTVEFVFGSRSCDSDSSATRCDTYRQQGINIFEKYSRAESTRVL